MSGYTDRDVEGLASVLAEHDGRKWEEMPTMVAVWRNPKGGRWFWRRRAVQILEAAQEILRMLSAPKDEPSRTEPGG